MRLDPLSEVACQNLILNRSIFWDLKGGIPLLKTMALTLKNPSFPIHLVFRTTFLPKDVQCKDPVDFKIYTNKELKPPRYKHFSRGNKLGNSLLTKIRVGRSDLKQHRFTIGLSDSPECLCHHREESPLHFFIDCFLYLPERQTLFERFEHYIPNFPNFPKYKKTRYYLKRNSHWKSRYIALKYHPHNCCSKLYPPH